VAAISRSSTSQAQYRRSGNAHHDPCGSECRPQPAAELHEIASREDLGERGWPCAPSSRDVRIGMVGDAQLTEPTSFTTQVCPLETMPER
jgi:hypothetical protein